MQEIQSWSWTLGCSSSTVDENDDIYDAIYATSKVACILRDYAVGIQVTALEPEADTERKFSLVFGIPEDEHVARDYAKLSTNAITDPLSDVAYTTKDLMAVRNYLIQHFSRPYVKFMFLFEGTDCDNYREYWNCKVERASVSDTIEFVISFENYNDMILPKGTDMETIGITEVTDGEEYIHEFRPWEEFNRYKRL